MASELDTVIIYTGRMKELALFYRQGLGLPRFEPVGADHVGQTIGHVYFGFDQTDAPPAGGGGSRTTAWFAVDDLGATFDQFVRMGARVKFPPTDRPWGGRAAAVFDPDGNLVGLAQKKK